MSATYYRLVCKGSDGLVASVSDHFTRRQAKRRALWLMRRSAARAEAGETYCLPVNWRIERHRKRPLHKRGASA